ncbi:MAG: ATP phosphoribosyltransferase regulatory subunit, partial [Candidatus Methanomethylophilaceae archaeon]|nr:ATP phosphoribosyltransferase regulatory subunit [Candidatus Methanomethylophilaceae archaeon]
MKQMQKTEETLAIALRELYRGYGYQPYKMSRFEEYDLYVRNKDFLLSDSIITFTDADGRLMALKPDVTLSIVKNCPEEKDGLRKVYYNETVYRPSKEDRSFREIMQIGLECIGSFDTYGISEVLSLAAKTLGVVSDSYVLDVSHVGLLSSVLRRAGVDAETAGDLTECLHSKNGHGLLAACLDHGVSEDHANALLRLLNCSGSPYEARAELTELFADAEWKQEVGAFFEALSPLPSERIRVDFSVIHDIRYYSGVVFEGYVKGIPNRVLSGGQYDHLMRRIGKDASAIGFALYLDALEPLLEEEPEFDADVLLLYGEQDTAEKV